MPFTPFLFVIAAVAVALVAVIGAVAAWRAARATGQGLARAEERLAERALALPAQLIKGRTSLEAVNAATERGLLSLAKADERLERATAALAANRAASDSLRVRLINGQLSMARIREIFRILVRLDKLRREFT